MRSPFADALLTAGRGTRAPPFTRLVVGIAFVLGLAMFLNGVVMLLVPFAWYKAVPGVIETGPFNQHLVRDIALLYALIGAAFIAGAFRPSARVACWGTSTVWLAGHAVFNFWEIAAGICGTDVIPRDFPAVTLPAVLGLAVTMWAWRSQSKATSSISYQ